MIDIKDKKDCCGCGACAAICPTSAISMVRDGLGFFFPKVDESKCISCSKCYKVCSFNAEYSKNTDQSFPLFYAARHKDINEIGKSQSGAAFIALSDWVLSKEGVIYGAAFTSGFRVVHKRAENKTQRDEFRGSKYVQSEILEVFSQLRQDLLDKKYVLFSGTPCQTSAIQSYLKLEHIKTDTLYLVDIICHGVPSPYIWRDYLFWIEKKYASKVIVANFRDKSEHGWSVHLESFKLINGKKIYKAKFKELFYKHLMMRHSCSNCHFSNTDRPSDITIGDFWGWEKSVPEFNKDNKGVSLVIVNSSRGAELFNEISCDLFLYHCVKDKCLQPNLVQPSSIHPKRERFEADYVSKGFMYIKRKYTETPFTKTIKRIYHKIRTLLSKVKRVFIKEITN